jgi:hypothetical protein
VDNLLYCTQKPQYFVTLKVTKPKLRLNFIPSHTCGAYYYLLLHPLSNFDTLFFWGKTNGTHPLQKGKQELQELREHPKHTATTNNTLIG